MNCLDELMRCIKGNWRDGLMTLLAVIIVLEFIFIVSLLK